VRKVQSAHLVADSNSDSEVQVQVRKVQVVVTVTVLAKSELAGGKRKQVWHGLVAAQTVGTGIWVFTLPGSPLLGGTAARGPAARRMPVPLPVACQ
jgi:hypothetical protein